MISANSESEQRELTRTGKIEAEAGESACAYCKILNKCSLFYPQKSKCSLLVPKGVLGAFARG